ncbi:MAG TPA: SIS domain-containing protein, partial [Nitrospirae bacterium]|nr:SIS domain-containing protein [Nitrospirota bacterium]
MTAPDEFYASRIRGHQETIQEMLDDEALIGSLVEAGRMMEECFRAGGRLLVCGNGGSAADSQHIAT